MNILNLEDACFFSQNLVIYHNSEVELIKTKFEVFGVVEYVQKVYFCHFGKIIISALLLLSSALTYHFSVRNVSIFDHHAKPNVVVFNPLQCFIYLFHWHCLNHWHACSGMISGKLQHLFHVFTSSDVTSSNNELNDNKTT